MAHGCNAQDNTEKIRDDIRGTDMEDSREDLRALARAKDNSALRAIIVGNRGETYIREWRT